VRLYSVLLTAGTLTALLASPALAQLGTNTPPNDDATLKMQRETEAGTSGSGIFDIPLPDPNQLYQPASRVPRDKFGVVSSFMPNGLKLQDLDALVYPGTTDGVKGLLAQQLVHRVDRRATGDPLADHAASLNRQLLTLQRRVERTPFPESI